MRALLLCTLLSAACGTQVADSEEAADPLAYRLDIVVQPRPLDGMVDVTMRLTQSRALLRELRLRPDTRISRLRGDGELVQDPGQARWLPPADGGTLSWTVAVPHRRNGDGYDAWLGADFGLFRAEDIIPRASSRTLKGASSDTRLRFRLPAGWTVVTQYRDDGTIRIDNPERRLDLPSGWIVMGDLGVRREQISGMRVAVAGPVGHSIRRLDTLALLNWTLPELARIVPELPPRLTVVSAGDPMWRGGLSAPQSLFLHAARPLISENATSTLLHEIMHMALGLDSEDGYDWIIEGLAEFYSLQLLVRSGTISATRHAAALQDLAEWAQDASSLCGLHSTGPRTALAVGVMTQLDAEIAQKTEGEASLDDVTWALVQLGEDLDLAGLIDSAAGIIGHKPDALHSGNLPGCRSIQPEPVTN
ncbi:MAG: hypothetical protein QNJ23_08425 [Woeseiaceae bacterium]|nr:hypothetical protein [Woeseiaceae bacterium]